MYEPSAAYKPIAAFPVTVEPVTFTYAPDTAAIPIEALSVDWKKSASTRAATASNPCAPFFPAVEGADLVSSAEAFLDTENPLNAFP